MVRLLLKLDYLIIFVISHNYFIISCHIWSFFVFVNYLSSSSCIFFVFPYIMYSYILDILFLIVLSFSFGGHFLYGNSVSPYCFPLPTVLLHIVFFLWWWLLLLVGVHFCTVVKSIIKHDMNRQVFIHFFSLRFPCRKVSRLMHRLYSESRQEPRSEDQGTRRNIKELHYTSIKVKGRFDGESKGGKCRYLNFLSRKNTASIEEGLNGCIMTDCLSESLLQLSILCDLDFIVERSKLNLEMGSASWQFMVKVFMSN